MRTLVHLSDFHFGNAFDFLLDPLIEAVTEISPDLVIVSGDFVEHATAAEFSIARTYLEQLPKPQLVVPGNHDLPFYDPVKRYRQGLRTYLEYISNDLSPVFKDEEIVVVGVSTPRLIPMKGGRISPGQVASVGRVAGNKPSSTVRVLVTHHPLDLPADFRKRELARGARWAVEQLSCTVDLMLAGHIHLSSTGATAARYRKTGHSVIFAQAGTAISKRNKGEPNSFNVIHLSSNRIEIQHYSWNTEFMAYKPCPFEYFEHCESGWCKIEGPGKREQVQL